MTLLAIWTVLEEIVMEFRKKNIVVPSNVRADLNSAKVLINIADTNEKSQVDVNPKIAAYLSSIEVYLVSEAPKSFTTETVEKWLKQLETASQLTCTAEEKAEPRFKPSLPRRQKWVRVKPLENLSVDKLETFAVESMLSFRAEEDGQLLVYGNAEAMKAFIKKLTAQIRQH